MQEIRDPCLLLRQQPQAYRAGPTQARLLRQDLAHMATQAASGCLALTVATPEGALVRGAPGHFHLSAELFLQCEGFTDFRCPNGQHHLGANQALLVPAMVLHDEHIGPAGPAPAQAFRNLVLHAEDGLLSCHLAHEQPAGQPAVLHLESLNHPLAHRIQDWLADAARLGRLTPHTSPDVWANAQASALVAAALAASLRLLGQAPAASGTSAHQVDAVGAANTADVANLAALPDLLARASWLLSQQLGEQGLSVQSLAAQCGCSADHLSRLFAQHHGGQTLKARIQQLRLARAAQLLADTPLSVKEITWACGFGGASYFIHSFKQRYGSTPLGWRRGQ